MEGRRDASPDRPGDNAEDIRWLTYAELGELLGIDPGSAKRRAFRSSWRRVPGNDGRTRVAVPATIITEAESDQRINATRPGDSTDSSVGSPEDILAQLAAAHASEIERLATLHQAELERLAIMQREAVRRLEDELKRTREDLKQERVARQTLEERAFEALIVAQMPWWRKLLLPKKP